MEVLTYSDDCEQSGTFQKLVGLNLWKINENNECILNGKARKVSAAFEVLHMQTSMYKGLTVHELIDELLQHNSEKLVVYHPDGFTFENRYNVIKKIKILKCRLTTLTFHDSMDHENNSSEEYTVAFPAGEKKVVLL